MSKRKRKQRRSANSKADKWKKLNWELYRASERVSDCLARITVESPEDVFANIARGFVEKSTRTLKSVNILYDSHLEEQAQVLVRVLFELRLNFDCFIKLTSEDLATACRRVLDAMMLEKIKQLRDPGFSGIADYALEVYEDAEKRITETYGLAERRNMAKYGFTGRSIEGRARLTGHEQAYSIVYRNFSRNVHSTDYLEHSLQLIDVDRDEYLESRDVVGLYTAHFSTGGIAELANAVFDCGLEQELDEIGLRQRELKDAP